MFVDAVRVNLILAESNFSGGRLICRDAYSSRQFRYSAVRREKKTLRFTDICGLTFFFMFAQRFR